MYVYAGVPQVLYTAVHRWCTKTGTTTLINAPDQVVVCFDVVDDALLHFVVVVAQLSGWNHG